MTSFFIFFKELNFKKFKYKTFSLNFLSKILNIHIIYSVEYMSSHICLLLGKVSTLELKTVLKK